jgi:mycofactocin system glycosyltransferase
VVLLASEAVNWPLPRGSAARLRPDTIIADAGRTLIGGWPRTAVFLAPDAARLTSPAQRDVTSAIYVSDDVSAALVGRLLETGIAYPVLETLPPVAACDLTVVVPVRDRPQQLDRLLAFLAGCSRVIVVDDASRDPAPVAASCEARGAHFVPLLSNCGPGGARNAGLALVRTPYVAFVDSDVVATPASLLALSRHFADPRVALVGPRVGGLESPKPNGIEVYEADRSSLDLGSVPALVRPFSPVAWLPAACLLGRVNALTGGFEEELRVGEDVDLVWRLVSCGYRVRYEPAVCVQHEHRAKVGLWLKRKAEYGSSAARLAQRHPGKVAPAVLAPWSVALILSLAAQRWWSLPVASACAALTFLKIRRRLGRSGQSAVVAARLVAAGSRAALSQAAGMALRHWWPAVLVASVCSRRGRRAFAALAIGDAAISWWRSRRHLGPLTLVVLRRLDHCAYGAGLWWGAARFKSPRALIPISAGAASKLLVSLRSRCH